MTTPIHYEMEPYLRALVQFEGSDIHLKVGSPPKIRVKGSLVPLDTPPLTAADAERMIVETMNGETKDKFEASGEADYAISISGVGRFRANAFRARGSVGFVARLVAGTPLPLSALNVPDVISQLAVEPRGLVLVTGPTGSGKSLRLDTPIPTPSGETTMGDLEIGDEVFGRDGKVCKVTYLSPVDETPDLYRVKFSDGQEILANGDHQWLVASHHERSVPRTQKRKAAVARHKAALFTAEELEGMASDVDLPSIVTAQEIYEMLHASGLAAEFPSADSVKSALKMVECPSFESDQKIVVEYTVERTQSAVLFDTAAYLKAVAEKHRFSDTRAVANRLLEQEISEDYLSAQALADLFGIGQSSVRVFAGKHNVASKEGVVSWTEDYSAMRPSQELVYPADIALKSLALRLQQRFSSQPSETSTLTRMTTSEIVSAGVRLSQGHSNYAIPVAGALKLPEAELPVDPYVLGAWLGDGSTGGGSFTQSDHSDGSGFSDMSHLIEIISAAGYGARKSNAKAGNQVITQGLMADLRVAGVLNKKHVPASYARASYTQRLSVLQGLMDTDGTVDAKGFCELSLSNKILAENALDLIRGLGIKATATWDLPVSYTDQHGEAIPAKDRHRIHFTTNREVFRLPRKSARIKSELRETANWVYITDIEPVSAADPEYGPVRCITVDSEDHTYLCGSGYIPTSNTTTLGGMLDLINETKAVHILTIEDPIEIMHPDKTSTVNQREVGTDTADFKVAMKAAMRQDPDVILIGEMRDAETVHAAVSAAETGHFVMSTLHTTDASETINRIVDFFPPNEQKQVRVALAQSLKGIICQRLVPTADGAGRACVMEVLVNTARVAEAIADESKTHEIPDLVAEGGHYGMQTFDQHLVQLVLAGRVAIQKAKIASTNSHDLSVMLKQAGLDPREVDAAFDE